ncbi:MAG: hydrogenase maturation protease [Nitrospira sp.]|jgi:hydrogenase maturation protease|nr:hydrogenase maturation protease [Nitrospira sp.]
MRDELPDERGKKRASGESRKPRSSRIRIIGLGNGMRGDDAVGLLVAHRLRQEIGDRVDVIEAEMAGVDLVELMKGANVAILVDAARSGQAAGTIHRLDGSAGSISAPIFPRSSHAIGTADALELARAMGVLPATVIVYGVEVENTEVGRPLSSAVAKVLEQVVGRIVQDCEACRA